MLHNVADVVKSVRQTGEKYRYFFYEQVWQCLPGIIELVVDTDDLKWEVL